MQTEKIRDLLEDAGFELSDRGSYWSTSAIWRNGDNTSAVQIYKDTGVWIDYVENNGHLPLSALIDLIYGKGKSNKILKKSQTEHDIFNFVERKVKIKMTKSYNASIINDLLPHHKFYLDKGISEKVLKAYRSGFATFGKMNARYVFPIFKQNNPEKIIGFTGRSFLSDKNNNIPKWKHIGQKKEWLYPCYIPYKGRYPFLDSINDSKLVYLIESVGDSLAMTQNGLLNHIVTFGTSLSSEKILFLSSLEPEKIIISTNNDYEKENNIGKNSAIKIFVQLMDFFDLDKISIKLPILNDLSLSHEKNKFKDWQTKKIDEKNQKKSIYKILKNNHKDFNFTKKINIQNKIEKLEFYLNNEL